MTLLAIGRFFAGLLSLVLLATASYLLWSWQEGETIRDAAGALHRDRDAWRLWTGLALLAWSFFGRFALLPLIAKPDERPTRAERGPGDTLTSSTGSSLYVEAYGRQDAPTIVLTHGWGMDSTFW